MIGIFGGTFCPIHLGHTQLAEWIVKKGFAKEVWLMVTPQNPFKRNKALWDDDLRLRLAQIAVRDVAGVKVSDFEFSLEKPSYTWKTLSLLTEKYPNERFALIIGADNWVVFRQWAHWEELLEKYPVLIYPREGYVVNEEALPPTVRLMPAPLFPYSSTEIRERLKRGEDVTAFLAPGVWQEIEKARL